MVKNKKKNQEFFQIELWAFSNYIQTAVSSCSKLLNSNEQECFGVGATKMIRPFVARVININEFKKLALATMINSAPSLPTISSNISKLF